MAHLRSLLDEDGFLANVAVPLPAFPESSPVLRTLRQMQHERQQMPVVVEHGGVEGIVTIEDLVEEIVGEIYDEDDPDILGVVHRDDDAIELPGSFPVHDLVDLGMDAPGGSYSTVAGFILHELERIPQVGDSVEIDGWTLHDADMSGNTVARVMPTGSEGMEEE